MKVLLLTLLAIGGALAGVERNPTLRIAEDNIKAFFDCLREIGYTGNEENAIPVMDPLYVEEAFSDLAVDVGTQGLSGTARVLEVAIVGILGFEYAALSGTIGILPLRYILDATLRFPRLQTSIGTYDVNIVFEPTNTNLYGEGTIAFDATDLYVRIQMTVRILTGAAFEGISVLPSLYGMNSFIITGLYNDEEYSQQVSDNFLNDPYNAMANIAGTIDTALSSIMTELLNSEDLDLSGDSDSLIMQCAFP
uniref:Uncharacterized protein n=1 Tax=Oryctes rhinoceros TaxID=72550 RepID=A0A5C0C9M9_ORYRH|nr:uncharacterized protein [Oryctes rhinoceros]